MQGALRRGVLALCLVSLPACQCDEQRHGPKQARVLDDPADPVEGGWEPAPVLSSRAGPVLWWEAEHPTAGNFPERNPFAPSDEAQQRVLSGGDWVGTEGSSEPLFLEYRVDVKETGAYRFYVRKFWAHGSFRWRFDDAPWRLCDQHTPLLDGVQLREHVSANWVELGNVELARGEHLLRVELAKKDATAAFDAFVLSAGDFTPFGKYRPGERPAPPSGWHAFSPRQDPFAETPLDLRRLNQSRAGVDGFVTARQGEFVFAGSGRSVRFWGMNAGHEVLRMNPEQQQRYARRLAKLGVNLVRLHGALFDEQDYRRVDQEKLRGVQRLIGTLSEQGIYLGLSVYFPVWLRLGAKEGYAGYGDTPPFGLSYVDAKFEAVQRDWWREILTTPDPVSGRSLASNPALAFVELINEDSTLFWTFQPYGGLPPAQTEHLERGFGRWLAAKYGSLAEAASHWSSASVKGDDIGVGRAGVMSVSELAQAGGRRAFDTAEYLARLMREHYGRLYHFIRSELQFAGLVICSNWHTADERRLGPLDNWANAACDAMDRHAYVAGSHEGPAAAYSVAPGQQYDDRSLLRFEVDQADALPPFLEPRYEGKPSFVSELGFSWPNRFRAEGPLLVAAYGRLTGLDAPIWFIDSTPTWALQLSKFETADPTIQGQFPAAALLFRQGLVSEAAPVAELASSAQELFTLRGAALIPTTGIDTFRAQDVLDRVMGRALGGLDPLALLVGPVDVTLAADESSRTLAPSIAAAIRPAQRTVTSANAELIWDFGRGRVEVRTAQLQAALGFFEPGGDVELPAFTATVHNDYATLTLVALDERPLTQSSRVLLQVGTEASNTGWSAPGQGLRTIVDAGGPPILVRNISGVVRLKRPDASRLQVSALDVNGSITHRFRGSAAAIALLPDAIYYLIEPAETARPEAGAN